MSVIVEHAGGDARAVQVDPKWRVAEMVEAICEALESPHPKEQLRVTFGDVVVWDGGGEATLPDLGIVGADERLHVGVDFAHVARAVLRADGVDEANCDARFADAVTHAVTSKSAEVVGRYLATGWVDEGAVVRALAAAAGAHALEEAFGSGFRARVPPLALERAFGVAVPARDWEAAHVLAREGLDLTADNCVVMRALRTAHLRMAQADASTVTTLLTEGVNVRDAVRRYPWCLKYAPSVYATDCEMMLLLPTRDLRRIASANLLADKAFMMEAVARSGLSLQAAEVSLRDDRELVLAAVAEAPAALRVASARLRGDRTVVMRAVARGVSVLQYASAELRADRDVVLAAVCHDLAALGAASEVLQADRDIVRAAAAHNIRALEDASPSLRTDRAFMEEMVRVDPRARAFAAAALRDDPTFAAGSAGA